MSFFSRKPDSSWYMVSLLWLITLVVLSGRRWQPQAFVWLQHVPGEVLWPLCILSIALGISSLRVLFATTEHVLVTHYATLESMRTVQRCGLLSLLVVPLLGVLGVAFLYPSFVFSDGVSSRPCHPWQPGIHALFLFALGSLFLWQSHRWLRAGTLFLAIILLQMTPLLWANHWIPGTCHGFWFIFWPPHPKQWIMVLFLWFILGLSLRWIFQRKALQNSLQQSAYGLVGCVWLGQLGWSFFPDAKFWQYGLSWVFLVGLIGFLSWQGAVSLREVRKLTRHPHALSQLHHHPYIFGATFPLAFLLALTGWTYTSVNPTVVLLFIGSQLLAFQGFSVLQSVHDNTLGHPNPMWIWLRPVLIFLVLYFPFGAIAVAMLGSRS